MPRPHVKWWEKPDPSSPTVFLSHSTGDKAHADEVRRVLEAAHLRCWVAPRDIPAGQEWASAIVDGIHRSRALVVLLSVRSAASAEVGREVELASRERKPMVTVKLDQVALSGSLAFFLSPIQWIDATRRPLRPQLEPLVTTVVALLGPAARSAGPVEPPNIPPRVEIVERSLDDICRQGPKRGGLLRRFLN